MTRIVNPKVMGMENERTVFQIIRTNGPISRSEIAKHSNLSKPAVSSAVSRLLRSQLVVERTTSNHNKVGRKPLLLSLNPQALHFMCVDIGGTKTLLGVSNLSGNIIKEETIVTPKSWDQVIRDIRIRIERWAGIYKRLSAVALGVPGVVDREGRVSFAPNIEDRVFPLKAKLQKAVPMPVFVDNDVNLAAWGEAQRRKLYSGTVVYISIGTGVGAGIIIDGHLYRGTANHAGEIGWFIIDKHSLNTPNKSGLGYLEKEVSGPALVRKALQVSGDLHLREDEINPGIIFSLYGTSQAAEELVNDWIRNVAILICNLSTILDPKIVILGGGVITAGGKKFIGNIRELVQLNTQRPPRIEVSKYPKNAVLYGAIALCMENLETLIWGKGG